MKNKKNIPFSPPEILDEDISEVAEVLRSGWITTGPKTRQFESSLSEYCSAKRALCLNSATAGLFLALKSFDIGPGDEVITTPYTYAASANVILHCGARPVFVDINEEDFNIDPLEIQKHITARTKAVICVDYGGYPVDYDKIKAGLESSQKLFEPSKDTLQEHLLRPLLICDCAHSLGAEYYGKKTGGLADFSIFSFHAVKNLTTAEGGAILFNDINDLDADFLYDRLRLFSLHGQDKDAAAKFESNSWQYDISLIGYKFNMPDIQAVLGLTQLKRYESHILNKRRDIEKVYLDAFSQCGRIITHNISTKNKISSSHLMPVRIAQCDEKKRNLIIDQLSARGISVNVHFIPVPMMSAYKKLGYNINNYPRAYNKYINEISCPIYSTLSLEDAGFIADELITLLGS